MTEMFARDRIDGGVGVCVVLLSNWDIFHGFPVEVMLHLPVFVDATLSLPPFFPWKQSDLATQPQLPPIYLLMSPS